jgi:hypothetical protein
VNETMALVLVNDMTNPDLQMTKKRVLILFTMTILLKIV